MHNLPDKFAMWRATSQVFGKDSILHLGGVETADSRDAWAADTNMEVRLSPSSVAWGHAMQASCIHPLRQGTDRPSNHLSGVWSA